MQQIRRRALGACLAATLAACALLAPAGGALAAPPAGALSEVQKTQLAIDMMSGFVPHAEAFWDPTDQPDPNVALPQTTDVGHFRADGAGVDYYRGNGDIAQLYATLLAARPAATSFGGVPRATVFDHLRQTIRYMALSNKLWNAAHSHPWGSWPLANPWQQSLESYNWMFAAWLVRDQLDAATLAAAAETAAREADAIAAKAPVDALPGDTGAEDNAWDTPLPIVAIMLNPTSPRVGVWRSTAIRSALNANSAPGDDSATTPTIDGQSLGAWVSTSNMTSDHLIVNHGIFNPVYQAYVPLAITEAAALGKMGGQVMPQAFLFRVDEVWDSIMGRIADGNGDIIAPAGQDWTAKDFQHLAYLAAISTRLRRADASVLESRALSHLRDRQLSHADGSFLGQSTIGYETMLAARLSTLYWDHVEFGPSPLPEASDYDAARAATAPVANFPSVHLVMGRLGRSFVSVSWDKASPMALVVPNGDDPAAVQPLFAAYPKGSLINAPAQTAQAAYSCECEGNHIASAASLSDRQFAISGFPDGIAILHEAGAAPTFLEFTEAIPDFAPAPAIFAAGGQIGDLTGNWVDLGDTMGMIVRGSAGLKTNIVTISGNPYLRVIGAREVATTGTRIALMIPYLPHAQAAGLSLKLASVGMPAGWSGATALPGDGSLRLSFARWSGATTATITISDPRGAPVMRGLGSVSGSTLTSSLTAASTYAHNEIANFFVRSAAAIRAKTESGDLLHLFNPTAAAATVAITWVTAGVERSTSVSVPANGELLLHRSGALLVP
jgi:hypothetical protein